MYQAVKVWLKDNYIKRYGSKLSYTNDCTSIGRTKHVTAVVGISGDKHPLFSYKESQSLTAAKLSEIIKDFKREWGIIPF
jgi:DNA-binding Lrp family transcriptional regulator